MWDVTPRCSVCRFKNDLSCSHKLNKLLTGMSVNGVTSSNDLNKILMLRKQGIGPMVSVES